MLDRQYIKERIEIEIICEFLRQKGFDEITPTQETNKYDRFDIYAKKDGYDYVIETKARSFPHNRFCDILVEKLKLDGYLRRREKNNKLRGLVFNIYNDNTLACNIITDYFKTAEFIGPKTTAFTNNEYVTKKGVYYKQRHLYKFNIKNNNYEFEEVKK